MRSWHQTPEVEASQADLLASLPEPFASSLLPTAPSTGPTSFASLASDHARLVSLAQDRIAALREFNSDNEEWDWKARVELDEDEADEVGGAGEAMQVDEKGAGAPRAWTPQEVQAFMRTKQRPTL